MINEQDPEGLMKDIKEYSTCEDCGKKIKPEFKKCYNCYMESKDAIQNNNEA
tara:strand:- start:948 stop:1103 length:156 start_codon:yes stop_codon:yes gene_type:complete